jgi:hypothetical protein
MVPLPKYVQTVAASGGFSTSWKRLKIKPFGTGTKFESTLFYRTFAAVSLKPVSL